MILSISFFHSWLITLRRPSGLISSLDAALLAATPAVAFVPPAMFLSEAWPMSEVVDWSPVFSPRAKAAAYCFLSISDGIPLFSLISWVIFIMSRFLRVGQFFMQNWKYPSLLVTGFPSRASSDN